MTAADPASVLLVEDHHDSRELYALYLSSSGFRVETAATGSDALSRVRAALPDVVVIDVGLPDVDGLEVVKRIRADETVASLPVIALSGFAAPADERRAERSGCTSYLRKPCLPEELLAEIQRVLARQFAESVDAWARYHAVVERRGRLLQRRDELLREIRVAAAQLHENRQKIAHGLAALKELSRSLPS